MKRTAAVDKAIKKYESEKIDKLLIRVPKGKKAIIQDYAAAHGESVNGMINRLIDEELSSDTAKCDPGQ